MGALLRLPPLETGVLVLAIAVLVALGAIRESAGRTQPALDSYSTYDSATGGYGALYELLARAGVRVDRFEQRPAFLDASVDTLVWAEPLTYDKRQLIPTRADVRALDTWVRGGGRFLYIGYDDDAAREGILGLPVSRPAAAWPRGVVRGEPLVRGGALRVDVTAARRYRNLAHARVLFDDGRGAVAVDYALGRGHVTALIDEAMFSNARLARFDDARLAVAFAQPGRSGGLVSFDENVHGYAVVEHWWQIVPRPFAIALLVAAVALSIAFAGAAVRLGPPLAARERDTRTTADFTNGLASLLARGRAARFALDNATRSTARNLGRALGLRPGATDAEIETALEDSAARAAFVELVAMRAAAPSDREFVRAMALAERLRKEYAAHGPPRY